MKIIFFNNELITSMRKFKEVFGDTVPLRELPHNIANEDLIAAINDSIAQNCNLLPERFGFKELESDKNILM